MKKYKVLLFDLGNVVLTNDWFFGNHPFPRVLSQRYGLPMEQIDQGFYAYWPELRIGKMSETDFLKSVLRQTDASDETVDFAKQLWRQYQQPTPGMFDLITKLKSNYQLAVLSNIAQEWYEFKRDTYHLNEYFNPMIMSWEVGIPKPETGIFQVALNRLGCDSSVCIVIDDDPEVIRTAISLGFDTVFFKNVNELESSLREKGIKPNGQSKSNRKSM